MFPLIALAALSSLAVLALVVDLFDTEDAEETVDTIEENDGFSLLDDTVPADLQSGALSQVAAGAEVIDADTVRNDYAPTGSVEIEGTDGDDFIDAGVDVEVSFGGAGDDVLFGADHDQVLFGDEGDDVIFAEGGADQTFGEDGADTLVGGDGGDLLVGGQGADVIYGGDGADTIHTAHVYPIEDAPNTFDVASAGAGDDVVYVSQGSALIALGDGDDDVLIYSEYDIADNDPVAIISDFESGEDQIVIGVHAPDFTLPDGASSFEIDYSLTQIDTADGPATLVIPAVDDEDLLASFVGANIGHAVLLGVTPDQVQDGDVRVLVTNTDSNVLAADSIQTLFDAQSVGSTL